VKPLALLLALGLAATAAERRPDILLLYADDLGYTDLSCQGSNYYESPNIDRLAEEGMTFTQAYAAAANCAPSRASLVTGLHTPRHRVFTVGTSARGESRHRGLIPTPNRTTLDPSLPTLPRTLQAAGYATCSAGKWHLSKDPRPYGFDANFGGTSIGHPKSFFSPYHNPALEDGPPGEHLPARLAEEVTGWIEAQPDEQPLFVYLPFYSVHTPIEAPEPLIEKYRAKPDGEHHDHPVYAAMIEAMDRAVGEVLAALDRSGRADSTLVIFSSDNGPHGRVSNARPLRGKKGMFYEGGIRVPMLVRWPGVVDAGSRCETPVSQIDLFPTLAAAAGVEPPARLDGIDLAPLLRGDRIEPRALFWHFPAYLQSSGPDPDSRSRHFRTTPCGVIREDDWKLIEYFEDDAVELYDLRGDPDESDNLAAERPEVAARLQQHLVAWRERVDAPVPNQPNPDFGPAAGDEPD